MVTLIIGNRFLSLLLRVVTTKDLKTEEVKTGYYDGVLVCVGHHAFPYYPLSSFPGRNIMSM